MTVAVPAVKAVKTVVQVEVPTFVSPARLHGVNVPVTPLTAKVTVPVGVMRGPGVAALSVTPMRHVDP